MAVQSYDISLQVLNKFFMSECSQQMKYFSTKEDKYCILLVMIIFTCKDDMLFLLVKVLCFHTNFGFHVIKLYWFLWFSSHISLPSKSSSSCSLPSDPSPSAFCLQNKLIITMLSEQLKQVLWNQSLMKRLTGNYHVLHDAKQAHFYLYKTNQNKALYSFLWHGNWSIIAFYVILTV